MGTLYYLMLKLSRMLKQTQFKKYLDASLYKETFSVLFCLVLIVVFNWIIPEETRIHFYENLRLGIALRDSHSIVVTITISIVAIFAAIVGWFGINNATDSGIPKLEIATASFTKTLFVAASVTAVLNTIGSSGGEIASAFFEGLRIMPKLISGGAVDTAGIFSVYVANFSGVVNTLAAVAAGMVLIFLLLTKKIDIQKFAEKTKELSSQVALFFAAGLVVLYTVQSAVTWDGKPTFWQSLLIVIMGVILFVVGFALNKRNDAAVRAKRGRDFLNLEKTYFSLNPKRLGAFLATNTIGNSTNIVKVTPRFMLALAALISMLILPMVFILVINGFSQVVLAFAVAFITSLVEMLLVISAGEIALFLLLGSNVIDVIFGLFFGEVLPQAFGSISYHPSMPAISLYSAIFALATFVGVLLANILYKKRKLVASTISFIIFITFGGLFYNWAVFFDGITPMNAFINTYLVQLEKPIYYFSWAIVVIFGAVYYIKQVSKGRKLMEEVTESMVPLKDYFEGALFVLQVDGDSLRKHLGRVTYIVSHLFDAEKYLGGDGVLTIMVETKLVSKVITQSNYQLVLTELAHTAPPASPTILTDTINFLLDSENIADITMADTTNPIFYISLQTDLKIQDVIHAKEIVSKNNQSSNIILSLGCFEPQVEINNALVDLVNTPNNKWIDLANINEKYSIKEVLESLFDQFSDYIEKRGTI